MLRLAFLFVRVFGFGTFSHDKGIAGISRAIFGSSPWQRE
jgi:hypothetical protein